MKYALVAIAVAVVAIAVHLAVAAEPAEYEIRLPASATVPMGRTGGVSLTIAPGDGHSISKDGPLVIRLAVSPDTGLTLASRRYTRSDAADAQADAPRFDLGVEARTAGDYELSLDIRFWVCRNKTCRPVKELRTVPVKVPAPPPDAGPPDTGVADASP